MSQTVVNDAPSRAFEGMVNFEPERTVGGIAAELIFFGKAVSRSKTVGLNDAPPLVRGYTDGEILMGIARADVTVERLPNPTTGAVNQAPYGGFVANKALPLVTKGEVWVRSADVIDDLSKSVFIKNVDSVGTPATITDTTTYAVTDQSGLTSIVTIAGFAAQTVTYPAATTTALQVAAALNAQVVGASFDVVANQVVGTTDAIGDTQTIAIAAGTGAITWDTPVAGTGAVAILAEDARGSFRGTTASGYTEFSANKGLEWKQAYTEGGVNFALLAINIPA